MSLTAHRPSGAFVAAGVLCLFMVAPGETAGETVGGFQDVTVRAGLTHVQSQSMATDTPELLAAGGAVGDFFGNGRNDLFVTRHDNTDIFYMNMGDGTFEDRTHEVFGPNPINAPTNGALLADFDNDGHLDLYVTGVGTWRHYLYMNDGNGRLIEQARARGAAHERNWTNAGMSVTAGDYTGNGYLDLYISDWSNRDSASRLLRNRGSEAPGFFEDVTEVAGVGGPGNRWGFGARFADLNGNGLLDLLPYNDFGYNQFFWNQGDGTFREAAHETGTTIGFAEMGISIADFNNNGWLDIFLTDLGRNVLYRNEMHRNIPGLYFTDRSAGAGVAGPSWGWGAATIDYNNNGWRDIVMVTGFLTPEPMRFWRNNGTKELSFTEISKTLGLVDDGQGRGVIVADFTGNGWQDILVLNHAGQPILYENEGGSNSWIRIDLVGQQSNRQGIGARITVTPDLTVEHLQFVHEVNLEANFLSHSETTAHFGLGSLASGIVDHVHIRWPSGLEQDIYNLEANRVHTITENGTTTPPPSPERLLFDDAVTGAGLSGAEAEPGATPFSDGVENLLKYAFNMDLSRADHQVLTPGGTEVSGLPCILSEANGGEMILTIEFIRRRESDLTYAPTWSTDLNVWQPATAEPTVIEIDPEWERASVKVSLEPSATQGFGRVEVTLP